MRIESSQIPLVPESKPRADQVDPRPTTARPGPSDAAVVTVTPGAKHTAAVDHAIQNRVERVKLLLARGAYPIDLDRLAARILDDENARAGVVP